MRKLRRDSGAVLWRGLMSRTGSLGGIQTLVKPYGQVCQCAIGQDHDGSSQPSDEVLSDGRVRRPGER